MTRKHEQEAPGLAEIDAEIAGTTASLEASVRSHSMRLAALHSQRQLALVGRYIAANAATLMAEAAQAAPAAAREAATAAPAASPEPSSKPAAPDGGPGAGPKPSSAQKSPRKASGKPAGAARAAEPVPEPDPAPKVGKQPNPLVQAAHDALRSAGGPLTAVEIAKAIGVEPRRAAPYIAALLRGRLAVRSPDGSLLAA